MFNLEISLCLVSFCNSYFFVFRKQGFKGHFYALVLEDPSSFCFFFFFLVWPFCNWSASRIFINSIVGILGFFFPLKQLLLNGEKGLSEGQKAREQIFTYVLMEEEGNDIRLWNGRQWFYRKSVTITSCDIKHIYGKLPLKWRLNASAAANGLLRLSRNCCKGCDLILPETSQWGAVTAMFMFWWSGGETGAAAGWKYSGQLNSLD